jgi:hypothetical protein
MTRTELLQTPPEPGSVVTAPVRHLLVVANETLTGEALQGATAELVRPDGDVLVVCPILVSRAGYWACDYAAPLLAARERLLASLETLREAGLHVEGTVGDANPLQAIEDALCEFPADHILISTHPARRSTWLERRVVERARARFEIPVSHVVVDREASSAGRAARGPARAPRSRERAAAG